MKHSHQAQRSKQPFHKHSTLDLFDLLVRIFLQFVFTISLPKNIIVKDLLVDFIAILHKTYDFRCKRNQLLSRVN